MCIIVSKEKNIKIPSKQTLKNCFDNNSDGAGLMYTNKNKVIIEKGFMDFENFYNRVLELDKKLNLTKKSLVMHFRIGTSGKNDKATCHPFPITDSFEDLRAENTKTDLAMVHNGVISSFVYGDILSDTQNFVKDFVSCLYSLNKNFLKNKNIKKVLNKACNNTKLAFLSNDDYIYYFGDFVKDKDGVKYSNSTYSYNYKDYYYNDKIYNFNSKYYDDLYCDEYFDEYAEDIIYYEDKKELVVLSNNLLYSEDIEDFDFKRGNNSLCIDKDYNLFEILDNTDDIWEIKHISSNVFIYDKKYDILDFETIEKMNNKGVAYGNIRK